MGQATGRHLPYGITQCYLPPDTSEHAPPRASQWLRSDLSLNGHPMVSPLQSTHKTTIAAHQYKHRSANIEIGDL